MEQARLRFGEYVTRRFGQSSTYKHYMSDLKIIIQIIGNKTPLQVTAKDVDGFIEAQIAAGMKPTTINRRLASLHSLFEYLAFEDMTEDWPNPVIARRHYLKTGSPLPRDMKEDEMRRLFEVIVDERDRAMFGLMAGAGLRVGEVASLRLDGLEPDARFGQWTKVRVVGKGNKERVVWLTDELWETVQGWLEKRPAVEYPEVFLNHQGRPISVSGIQYRLKQYAQAAGVTVSCHRLRHTFARRLTEQGLSIDSLAKLLGHNQLQTTARYINGADPTVRLDFAQAMQSLTAPVEAPAEPLPTSPMTRAQPERERAASAQELAKLQARLTEFPDWLAEGLDAYLVWKWPSWPLHTAYTLGGNVVRVTKRIWTWLAEHREIEGWATFRRADLEAWVQARGEAGAKNSSIKTELSQIKLLLSFMKRRDYPLDPGLFRVEPPPQDKFHLPRHLKEEEYHRLEAVILEATCDDTYDAAFDRAWFFTLAHTGVRIGELTNLRLDDVDLEAGTLTVRHGKQNRDRVVYLSPQLTQFLRHYLTHRHPLPNEDHLFIFSRQPRPASIRGLALRLTKYGEQAQVKVSPHVLRHTLATRLLNQGMPIQSLRKLLGHQDLNTTLIYAQVYDETLNQQFQTAMRSLEAIPVDEWPQPDPEPCEIPIRRDWVG
jgi:site-specific recombinase XerD